MKAGRPAPSPRSPRSRPRRRRSSTSAAGPHTSPRRYCTPGSPTSPCSISPPQGSNSPASLGPDADRVHWITADLLNWTPQRRYAIWHDRALLHFFTDSTDRSTYAHKVKDALEPGGHAIITTFAPDGPDHCSGQPVHRSSANDILTTLGDEFELVDAAHSIRLTPADVPQAFTHATARRRR